MKGQDQITERKLPVIATIYFPEDERAVYLRLEMNAGLVFEGKHDPNVLWYSNSHLSGWNLVGILESWELEEQYNKEPAKGDLFVALAEQDHRMIEQIFTHLEKQGEGSSNANCGSRAW